MQTFCLVSTDSDWKQASITALRKKYAVTDINFHTLFPSPSIGIESVRSLQALISRKPYGGGARVIVLDGMEKATIEAQNALLKLLEEPPAQTYIIITTTAEEAVLPTVRSRCRIIRHIDMSASSPSADSMLLIKKIIAARLGDRILIAQECAKTKEDTLLLLHAMSATAQRQLHAPIPEANLSLLQWATILKSTENARRYVERNVNFKATLDILFLGLPRL